MSTQANKEQELVYALLKENGAERAKHSNVYRVPGRGNITLPFGAGGWSQALFRLRRLLELPPTSEIQIEAPPPTSLQHWANKYARPEPDKPRDPYAHLPEIRVKRLPSEREWLRDHHPQYQKPVVKIKPCKAITLSDEEKIQVQALLRWQGEQAAERYAAECFRCKRSGQPSPIQPIETEKTMDLPQRLKQLEAEEREFREAIQKLETENKDMEKKIAQNNNSISRNREAMEGVAVYRAALAGKLSPAATGAPSRRNGNEPGYKVKARERGSQMLAWLSQQPRPCDVATIVDHLKQSEPNLTTGAVYQQLRQLQSKARLTKTEVGGRAFWAVSNTAREVAA